MMLNEQEVKRIIDNPMKPTDTFKFSCKACGNWYYLPAEKRFGYFQQNFVCGIDEKHTLQEWLDEFSIHEWDEASSLWATVVTKLAEQTMKIKEPKAIESIANKLAVALYYDYDTSKSYTEQLARNIFKLMDRK